MDPGDITEDLGWVPDGLGYGPDGLGHGPDDGTAHGLVDDSGPVRDRTPGSGRAGDPAGDRPARTTRRRRDRTAQDDVLPARRRRWPWVVGAAAAVAAAVPIGLIVLGGSDDEFGASRTEATVPFGASTGSDQPGAAPAVDGSVKPAAAEVTYEVTGSGSAGTITFGRGTSVAQVSGAELPWQRTYPAAAEPTDYSVTAAGGSGEISCRIVVDGAVLSEESADGDYSAVSCNGRR